MSKLRTHRSVSYGMVFKPSPNAVICEDPKKTGMILALANRSLGLTAPRSSQGYEVC